MELTLYEDALERLLQGSGGPVAADARTRAERLREAAQANIDRILWRSPLRPQVQVQERSDPLAFAVGIADEGRLANYLANKERREGSWLRAALEAIR